MKKRVLLWVSLSSCVGRDICRGVYQYTRLHAPDWEVMHANPCPFTLDVVTSWAIDGIIGPFGRTDFSQMVKTSALPCVNMHGGVPFSGLPQVGINDRSIGETAADYFLRVGFEHFGYFGFPGLRFSDDRWKGYRSRLSANGKKAAQFTAPGFFCTPSAPEGFEQMIRPALKQWLTEQPRPFALFLVDDMRSNLIYSICREAKLVIPDDIALLGVSDDDIYCYKNNPPLSSIQLPSLTAGYRAAQVMDRQLKGGRPQKKPVLLDSGAVTERASTTVLKLADRQVVMALRFISENAVRGIATEEIARVAGLSRRVLEKRFRTLLNCSPQDEVRRTQIEQVKNALRETSLSLEEIAEAAGFTSGNYLSQIFKKITGQTPGAYRRNFR